MKKIILLIAVFSGLNTFIYAENFMNKKEKIVISAPEKTLKIGEKLQYSIEWLGIPVGKIILEVEGMEKIEGIECYHVSGRAIPNNYLSKIYDMEYRVHTYIDKDNFCTIRFQKIRRVRDKFNYVCIDFDRENKKARYKTTGSQDQFEISSLRDEVGAKTATTLNILDDTQDLFSSVYYLRLLEIKEGQTYPVNIYYDQRNWLVHMKTGKLFFRDIRHKGTFAVFEASLDSDIGKFILGKSKMVVYFTVDSRRIPVEFKFGTSVGRVRGVIQEIPN